MTMRLFIMKSIKRKLFGRQKEKGQSLIILALAFVAMLAFVGLVVDVGSLYVTYTQLKRAVDAAAVAAANNIKSTSSGFNKERLTEAAREMLQVNNVTDVSTLAVYLCSDSDKPSEFARECPGVGAPPRKLAWVQATQNSPVYFLSLFGVQSIPFTTSAVGEAATVDLVLVFDSSESMAKESTGYSENPYNFNPGSCNASNTCYPMRNAKDAAAGLVDNLFDRYDQVAVVSYAYTATAIIGSTTDLLTSDMDEAKARIMSVGVHDDPPSDRNFVWGEKSPNLPGHPSKWGQYNPIYPEDRDGDGYDADLLLPCVDEDKNMWDDNTLEVCDDWFPGGVEDVVLDTYDWNDDDIWGNEKTATGVDLTEDNAASMGIATASGSRGMVLDPDNQVYEGTSLVSTCTGCGLRVATDILKAGGRESSVWVIVFLTDGFANLSDNHHSFSEIPEQYTYGFCGADPNVPPTTNIITDTFWIPKCVDKDLSVRYCIDSDADECPPGSVHTTDSAPYSVADYAFDMADAAALLESTNTDEPTGEDIIIYSIALGTTTDYGMRTLRYIANVGEDGTRANDQCADLYHNPVELQTNCGNYYYAPEGPYLDQIFENIAGRIFTKISR
jgi:hypothetical protein